jgi:hypothetical protein
MRNDQTKEAMQFIAEQIANIAPRLRPVDVHPHAEQLAEIGTRICSVLPHVMAKPVLPPLPPGYHAALRQLENNSRVYPT